MTRNLKALGLALVAVFAMSAVAASAASAEVQFHSEAEATITAHSYTTPVFSTPTHGTVECEVFNADATIGAEATNDLSATAEYLTPCTVEQGGTPLEAHVHMNECYYTFTTAPGEEIEPGHKYKGSVHIKCPAEKQIEVKVTFLGERNCLDIGEQTPTTPYVDYTNTGEGSTRDINLISTVEGIEYTLTGPCGSGTFNDASYSQEVTLTGEDEEKNHIGIWVE